MAAGPCQGALAGRARGAGSGRRGPALTVSLLAVDHAHEQRRVPGELREQRQGRALGSAHRPAPPPPPPPRPAGPGDPSRGPGTAPAIPRALTLISGDTCTGGIILAAEGRPELSAAAEGAGSSFPSDREAKPFAAL